jgi:hypothetical protein
MAIDGLTTLTSVFQGDVSASAAGRSTRATAGTFGANVVPSSAHDLETENRMAGTYGGLVNPKKGIEELDDEGETYQPFAEEEEEEEEGDEAEVFEEELDEAIDFDWAELEDDEWDEDLEEDDDMEDFLTFKQEKGMFVDLLA